MDFIERLKDSVNSIPKVPIQCALGYLGPGEDLKLYAIPGGRVVREYYDGIKDQQLNFEFAMKSQDQQKINTTLWMIQSHLEELSSLVSLDGSFEFNDLIVTNKPYINALDVSGWYVCQLDIQATMTVYNAKGE